MLSESVSWTWAIAVISFVQSIWIIASRWLIVISILALCTLMIIFTYVLGMCCELLVGYLGISHSSSVSFSSWILSLSVITSTLSVYWAASINYGLTLFKYSTRHRRHSISSYIRWRGMKSSKFGESTLHYWLILMTWSILSGALLITNCLLCFPRVDLFEIEFKCSSFQKTEK